MGLKYRIGLSIIIGAVFIASVSVFVASKEISSLGKKEMIVTAQSILSRMESVRKYIGKYSETKALVESLIEKYPDGNLPKEEKARIFNQVPIVAAMKVGGDGAEESGYKFRVFAEDARNKDNDPVGAEIEILKEFENDKNLKELVRENETELTVYRPVHISESEGCLGCHGDPRTSPFKNGKDILGYEMENWKDQKMHGVFAISMKKDIITKATTDASIKITLISFVLILFGIGFSTLLIGPGLKQVMRVSQELAHSGNELHNLGADVSAASESLSLSTSRAAASVEETTAAAEEVSSMIRLNAQNSEKAREKAAQAQKSAEVGQNEVLKLVQAMTEIEGSSKKMEDIISVIDDIAFQTNLLALNAAVEAARAGDQGKGFAVVADAVRSLAQKSSVSASEISNLIKDSSEKIHLGSEVAHSSGESLKLIYSLITEVSDLNSEIAKASIEQSHGVENINQSITEFQSLLAKTAASAEGTAQSSSNLRENSENLQGLVVTLTNVLGGKKETHEKKDAA